MKASMGKRVEEVLSKPESAKRLTDEVIKNQSKDVIEVRGVLPNNKVLTLKKVNLNFK